MRRDDLGVIWTKPPRTLGDRVRITNPTCPFYNKIGHKQAGRPDGKVLIWFPRTKTTGYMKHMDWTDCERVDS